MCVGVFVFRRGPGRGDLFFSVTFHNEPGNAFDLPITGGTGTFTGDMGFVHVQDNMKKTQTDTFHLMRG